MNWLDEAEKLLTLAACLHLIQLPTTSWLAKRSLKLHLELKRLSSLNVAVVLVFMGAVTFLLVGLAWVVLTHGRAMLSTELGRDLCLVLGLFWLARAAAQVWLYRLWPMCRTERAIYFGLLGLYGLMATSYATAYAVATANEGQAQEVAA